MALEDFFTPTEMKDGLGTIDRVELLVSMIQKEKDSAMKNVGETSRQWSTVANTLAATGNMAILKHFIQLGGLDIFHQWLQEAQQYSDDTSESSMEESTCEMLKVLEKFPIDNKASDFSGIMASLENLMVHKSVRVQEKAKAVYDLLNHGMDKKRDSLDVGKDGGCQVEAKPSNATATVRSSSLGHSAVKFSHAEVDIDEVRNTNALPGSELQHLRSSSCTLLEIGGGDETLFSKKQNCDTTCNLVDENTHQSEAQGSSIISTPSHSSSDDAKESFMHPGGGTSSVGTCSSPGAVENNGKTSILNVVVEKGFTIERAVTEVTESTEQNSVKFVEEEKFNVSSPVGPDCVSSGDTDAQQSGVEPAILKDVDGKDIVFCVRKTLPTGIDSNTGNAVASPSDVATTFGVPKQPNSKVMLKTIDQHEGIRSNVSQDLSISGCMLGKTESVKSHLPGEINDVKEIALESITKEQECDASATSDISKRKDIKASDEIVKSGLDMELDLVEDNAPAIARRVGKEVEREDVDYREALCRSPSMKNSEARVLKPDSPNSEDNGVHDEPMVEPPKMKPADENLSGSVISFRGEDHSVDAKDMVKTEDCASHHEVSQAMEHDQEPACVKSAHGFDLNEESDAQEMDQTAVMYSSSLTGTSMPGCRVSAIITPTYFEGKAGCVSVAASNFRIPDAEIASSVEGSSNSKQKREFLDIDLNVADRTTELMLSKIPLTSGLLSGESSVEVDSSKRIRLDLNDTVADGARSPSTTSSSSLRQSGVRRLDLNDNPSLYEPDGHPSDHGASSSQGRPNFGGFQVEGPCISILGTRVPIFPQTRALFPNGHFPVSSMSANYAQSSSGVGVGSQYAMPYVPPSHGVWYNGLPMEPSMSLSSVICRPGPVLHNVDDPREPHMGQQIMGLSPAPPSYRRSLFPMSTTSAQPGFSWAGPSQPNLNLSSGLFIEEVEREQGASRQVLANMTDEQGGSSSQPMNSAALRMKMREPDNECDPYLGPYRRQPPWL